MPKYCLFGDSMNTASRMETLSMPNHIQISQATYDTLDENMKSLFHQKKEVNVKGKGLMTTYLYCGDNSDAHSIFSESTDDNMLKFINMANNAITMNMRLSPIYGRIPDV
jgi:class 3 adenylate cyclase